MEVLGSYGALNYLYMCVVTEIFIWTSCWDSDTALLRCGDTGKSFRAGALDILAVYLAARALPARYAGDHAHIVTALFSNQTVIRSWGIAALASP